MKTEHRSRGSVVVMTLGSCPDDSCLIPKRNRYITLAPELGHETSIQTGIVWMANHWKEIEDESSCCRHVLVCMDIDSDTGDSV